MKLDYDLPVKEKDLNLTLDYQNINTTLNQLTTAEPVQDVPNVDPVTSQTTGGQNLRS